MATPLTTEQRNAILKQSEWMTTEQKQSFATDIRSAQARESAKTSTKPVEVNTPPAIIDNVPSQNIEPTWNEDLIQQNRDKINANAWYTPEAIQNIPNNNIVDTPVTQTTPKTTTQDTVESTPVPVSIADWKTQWSDIATLEQMIEEKYWTVAENNNGVLNANIWWVDYQWNIDDAWNPIKTKVWWENPDDIYNQLVSWQTIAETWVKTTKAYSTAKARYDISNKYSSYTEEQLYNAYVNWEINWTLERDLATNPNLMVAKERYNKKIVTDNINQESINMLNIYNGKGIETTEEKSFLEKLSDSITSSFTNKWNDVESFKDYMSTNYPDLVTDTKDLNQKNTDLKVLVDARDARLDEIIKENPWISINRATMLATRQNKDVNAQIKSMSYEIGNLQANINYQSTMADKEYGYELQREAKQDNLDREQRAMQFDILKTADQRQYEADNKWVSTSVITRDWEQILINTQTWADIKNLWSTWGTAWAPSVERIGTDKSGNPIYWTYNNTTLKYEAIDVWQITDDINITTDNWVNSIVDYSTKLRGRENLQCWELVNDYWTKATWSRAWMWDTLKSKLDAVAKIWESETPVIWWLMVSNPLWNEIWHTWIIQAINADWSIDVLEANAGWSTEWEAPVIRTYSAEQFANMSFSESPTSWKDEYTKDVTDWGQNILTWKAKLTDITWNPELKTQVSSYIANSKPVYKEDDHMIISMDKDIKALSSLVTWDKEWWDDFWAFDTTNESLAEDVSGSPFLLSPVDRITWEKWQFLRKIQTVLDSQALKNLIAVKNMWATFGQLTEKEMSILQKSASLLNSAADRDKDGNIYFFTMWEEEFKKELKLTLDSLMNTRLGLLGQEEDLFDKLY